MNKQLALLALVVATGCKKTTTEKPAEQPRPATPEASVPWDGTSPLVIDGFATPESVLYDSAADVYLVSNINGAATAVDDNGYISKVSPDGRVLDAKWIDGAKDNVKLDAPKGMAIADGILWVADITVVRRFDAVSGEPQGEVKIDGATFLNDVSAHGPHSGIFVTDSGLDAKSEPSGTDAVYDVSWKGDKVTPLIKGKDLGHPNGVLSIPDPEALARHTGAAWVVTFGSGEIFRVDPDGKKQAAQKLPTGQLDGIVAFDGDLLVSSWEGSAIYRGKPGGEWKPIVEHIKSPADIGFDGKRRRLLIPSFQGNQLIIHPLP
jgi:hypothetical protein